MTFDALQSGGVAGTADTTKIDLTFSESLTGLLASHITVTDGSGKVTKGALTGAAKAWSLAVSNPTEGNVSITIAGFSGYKFPKIGTTVAVYAAP